MKRYNQILAGVLAVQIILSVVVFWPKSLAAVESELAFPDLEAGGIVALTITDGDGNSITLRQVGGSWVLPSADDYPAQADKITPLLAKIAGLTTDRLVTRTDTSHRRLQVAEDDFVRRVDLETADGTQHTFYLGSSPSYGATHFRLDGQDETYLTEDMTTWETDAAASAWVDTVYLQVNQDDVTKMTLENESGTFTFTKDAAGNWTMVGLPVGETLNEEAVTTLLQRATTVNLQAPLGKEERVEYGMDAPLAVVTLTTGEEEITLRVGAQDPSDNSYVVISSQSPYYARVAEFAVAHMVNDARDDFIQSPPTPTPEG
ncbi:MAG: hypothetical protein DRI77_14460 [Chloroflexi bacterium]|nr:MAG: hypothetical protein DRI77_14460 [Chloroflexota bacterium]